MLLSLQPKAYENANRGVVRVICLRHEPLGGRGVDIKKAWVLTFIDQVDLRRGSSSNGTTRRVLWDGLHFKFVSADDSPKQQVVSLTANMSKQQKQEMALTDNEGLRQKPCSWVTGEDLREG
eukprot:COSAG02_NODE_567_length_20212_cov_18.927460_10_plen_122_part_00